MAASMKSNQRGYATPSIIRRIPPYASELAGCVFPRAGVGAQTAFFQRGDLPSTTFQVSSRLRHARYAVCGLQAFFFYGKTRWQNCLRDKLRWISWRVHGARRQSWRACERTQAFCTTREIVRQWLRMSQAEAIEAYQDMWNTWSADTRRENDSTVISGS